MDYTLIVIIGNGRVDYLTNYQHCVVWKGRGGPVLSHLLTSDKLYLDKEWWLNITAGKRLSITHRKMKYSTKEVSLHTCIFGKCEEKKGDQKRYKYHPHSCYIHYGNTHTCVFGECKVKKEEQKSYKYHPTPGCSESVKKRSGTKTLDS